jgi:hypothetical protein
MGGGFPEGIHAKKVFVVAAQDDGYSALSCY